MPDDRASTADGVAIGPSKSADRGRRVDVATPTPVAADRQPAAPMPLNAARWRRAGLLFALGFTALIAIYIDTVLDLWDGWGRTGTFAHGYVIFPVSAWLIWRLRDRLRVTVPKVQPLALIPLAGGGLFWLIGHSAGVHAPEQYAFVAMIPCLVWAVFGNDVTRRILYPLAFLFFAVPAGDFLMPTLMDHTADFTVAALRFSGVPVFREGNYFSIPSGSWSVVEACSGLRYLIASITLGFLFAYLNYRSAWRRVAFIIASILVPIVANWLRAYMIVMIAHLSSNKLATGVDHIIYGWLFFGLVMMLLFWVGNFWRDDDDADLHAPAGAVADVPSGGSSMRAVALMTAAVIAIAAPWPAIGNRLERTADDLHPGAIAIDGIAGWPKSDAPFTTFLPHYLHARSSENTVFTSGDRKVALFVGYYSGQLSNGPMVTYGNDVVIVSDKVWGDVARSNRTVDGAGVDGGGLGVVQSEIKSDAAGGSERLLAWRWFWINGRLTTSTYLAKAYNALDKLTGRGDDSAVIVVTTPMTGATDPQAAETLEAFVKAAQPQITARLAAIHAQARQ
ncbi:MAG: exosortase A [Burkholderiaceae bacterium]